MHPPTTSTRLALLMVLVGAAAGAGASSAAAAPTATALVSRSAAGGFPDGPSFHPVVSLDRKAASLIAYDSTATDIVAGDANGVSDVFVTRRGGSFKAGARKATPWLPGATTLVSRGLDGQPADGPSFLPDLDGDQLHAPHCVAFLSDATNLVQGDTNGRTDAFVRDLRSGRTTRVSVNSAGVQADGASYDVQVDGACDRVAFTSDSSNLAFTRDQLPPPRTVRSPLTGSQRRRCRKRFAGHPQQQKKLCSSKLLKVPDQRAPAVTTAPPAGTRQVYVRILGGQPDDTGIEGLTFLASASNRGQAGAGNSFDAAFGDLGERCPKACGTTSGTVVAFSSDAANLTAGDGNGVTDVYRRSFPIPPLDFRQRRAKKLAYMVPATRLVSATAGRHAGNGASDQPAVNASGVLVAFRTAATDLVGGDGNGATDAIEANLTTPVAKLKLMSFTGLGKRRANLRSSNPQLSGIGSTGLIETDADNLTVTPAPDRNCVADVLFWNAPTRRLLIASADSDGHVSGNPPDPSKDPCPVPATAPALNPTASYFGNYAAFEDGNPLLELPLADQAFPGLRANPAAAATLATSDPRVHQVYVRFVGP